MTLFLFPSEPFARPRRIDSHFADQRDAVRALGLRTELVDLEALAGEPGPPLRWHCEDAEGVEDVVYRGWMLPPRLYAELDARVRERGARLRTSPQAYERAHELPGWYAAMADHTARTVAVTEVSEDALAEALRELDAPAAFVKDHTKSIKGDPDASVISDTTDLVAAAHVVDRFRELRGEDLAGHVLLRAYEDFTGPEVRTWWVDGRHVASTAHPDTPTDLPAPLALPDGFAAAMAALELPFVTADVARRNDGALRLVEIGDGQVSDVPTGLDLEQFYADILTQTATT